jgi:hypothetical protein
MRRPSLVEAWELGHGLLMTTITCEARQQIHAKLKPIARIWNQRDRVFVDEGSLDSARLRHDE